MTRRKPLDKDLYEAVVEEAKTRFAVWPSAYASGWVVKTYKARGGRYGGESKGSRTGLTKWFGESWVDLSRPIREDGEVVGYEPCGRKRSDDPADYPKCRPEREAMRMSKEEVADAVRRKRRAEASAPGRGSRARAPKRVATYRENPPTITLWRAADDDYIGDSASFAESREVAELYLDNPSFGGSRLYRAEVEPHDVLDLTADGAERLQDALNGEPRFGGAVGLDEIVPRIAEDLRDAGYQWVRVPESYPEGTVTWIYVGGPFGDEPELVEARANPHFTGPNDGTFDVDDPDLRSNPRENPFLATEDGSSAYYSTGGRYSPGVSFREERPDGGGDFVEWSPDAPPWFPATGIPSPAQRMLEPAFREWFKDSKVVDERGLPLVVWHSNAMWNTADDSVAARFNAFDFSRQVDLGMHFGTLSAARTVGGLCRPFYLSLQNPLRVPDMESWVHGYPFSSDLPQHMLESKKISFKRYSDYQDQVDALLESFRTAYGDKLDARPLPRNLDREWRYRNSLLLRDLLLNAGYDGVVYENEHEDEGSISWIALHPGQIKSVENDGTWDFNDPDVRRNPRTGEYQGEHLPPGPDDGAPMHDVDNMMPDYCEHPEWYFTGSRGRADAEAASIVCATRGRPWATVWVYRAVPPGVTTINPGDWVTQVRDYAKEHLDANLGGEGRILKARARAGSLFTEGNSHFEWGWWPDAERERAFERMLRAKRAMTR